METWADSRTPALAIVARGNQIETVTPSEFSVRSQSRPGVTYKVAVIRGRWSCECPFWVAKLGGGDCIHIVAARIRCGFQESAKAPEIGVVCERCRSAEVVKFGVRRNKSGPVARHLCRACGATFTGRDGYQKRRTNPEMIAKALDLYFRGVSVRQVAEHFAQAYGLKVSRMTVYRWVAHYSKLAAEWMEAQGAKVGETWHVDERVVNVNGDKAFLWHVMDAETRFLLTSTVSRGRGVREARAAFVKAKQSTPGRPTEVRSDGLPAYRRAVAKEFGHRLERKEARRAGTVWFNPHVRVPSIRAPESNNILERLNGTSKDRTKTMRAYDNLAGADALSAGWQVHYNLVRNHLALGTTPGVAAGMPEIAGFRWGEILRLAANRIVTHSPREGSSTD